LGNISHRKTDKRACGAGTVVVGQDFVFVNGKLWAVKNDPNDHGDGQLINTQTYVYINGKLVILVGDPAQPDDLCPPLGGSHCAPSAVTGDPLCVVN
jgi:uncharacterized Zn-binding protein involved in type VI secretion